MKVFTSYLLKCLHVSAHVLEAAQWYQKGGAFWGQAHQNNKG